MLKTFRSKFCSYLFSIFALISVGTLVPLQNLAAATYVQRAVSQAPIIVDGSTIVSDNCCGTPCGTPFRECSCRPGCGGGAIFGSILLGAAAGAGAGYAAGRAAKHHNGGGNPFDEDDGQTLTFGFSLTIAGLVGGEIVTPFVSTPDGNVIEGVPVTLTVGILPVVATFGPIVIEDPVFGTYVGGLQIQSTGGLTLDIVTGQASASRDGSSTTFLAELAVIPLAGQVQVAGPFVYGETFVP